MEPLPKKRKTGHLPDDSSTSYDVGAVETVISNDHINNFIPRCYLITSNILKYLSGKDLLNLSKVSRNWFTPCRDYLRAHQDKLQCLLVLDQVDGLEALNRLVEVLDAGILGQSHPFTGIYLKFSDRFDDFFKAGTGPKKRPPQIEPKVNPVGDVDESGSDDYDHYDYTQDYEPVFAWIERQEEEAHKIRQEQAKIEGPLMKILAKIPAMKHVSIVVDYGTKRGFQPEKFGRFMSILPLHQIEYFRTNLRISEFTRHLRPGQFTHLKTIHIDGLISAYKSTVDYLLAICPVLENWNSPVPGNLVALFGEKSSLIKNLLLTAFVKRGDFTQIRTANLALTTLIANSSICPIGKGSYDDIIGLIRDNRFTLQTIQMSDPFLKHLLKSDLANILTVRQIIIPKSCTKGTRTKALAIFPNAIFIDKTKSLY